MRVHLMAAGALCLMGCEDLVEDPDVVSLTLEAQDKRRAVDSCQGLEGWLVARQESDPILDVLIEVIDWMGAGDIASGAKQLTDRNPLVSSVLQAGPQRMIQATDVLVIQRGILPSWVDVEGWAAELEQDLGGTGTVSLQEAAWYETPDEAAERLNALREVDRLVLLYLTPLDEELDVQVTTWTLQRGAVVEETLPYGLTYEVCAEVTPSEGSEAGEQGTDDEVPLSLEDLMPPLREEGDDNEEGPDVRPEQDTPSPSPPPAGTWEPQYAWTDINHGTSIFGLGTTTYTVTTAFDRALVEAENEWFGIDFDGDELPWGDVEGTRQALHAHGLMLRGNTVLPDYRQITMRARAALKPLMNEVVSRANEKGVSDVRAVAGVVATLLQDGMVYQLPEEKRQTRTRGQVDTIGLRVPVDALTRHPTSSPAGWGAGDCDTKSVVFAALMTQLRDVDVVLLHGHEHMFAGVSIKAKPGDHVARVRGRDFVLVELTKPGWRVGDVAPELVAQLSDFEVVYIPSASRTVAGAP